MKFGIAKLPQELYKNIEKKFKRTQRNNNKELSSIEDRKVNTNLRNDGRKKFCQLENSVLSLGVQGALPPILVH